MRQVYGGEKKTALIKDTAMIAVLSALKKRQKEKKKTLQLTSFLHLQLSFGLLQYGLDSLIRTCLWGAHTSSNVTWKQRRRDWEEMEYPVRLKRGEY